MAVDDQYTVSLLHFDGSLTDESGKGWLNRGGGTFVSGWFGKGIKLDPADHQYVESALASNPDFNFGTGDYTIDFRLGLAALTGTRPILTMPDAIWVWYDGSSSKLSVQVHTAAGGPSLISNTNYVGWTHVALVRNGASLTLYQDGTNVGTVALGTSAMAATNAAVKIGTDGTYYMSGVIDELRISKGIARWTANFTPPTAPYGLSASYFPQVI